MEQFVQMLWLVLVHLPTSKFKSGEERRNCVRDIRIVLSFVKSKYSSNPKVCLNKKYVSNLDGKKVLIWPKCVCIQHFVVDLDTHTSQTCFNFFYKQVK